MPVGDRILPGTGARGVHVCGPPGLLSRARPPVFNGYGGRVRQAFMFSDLEAHVMTDRPEAQATAEGAEASRSSRPSARMRASADLAWR